MLGPIRTSFLSCVSLLAFLMDALDAYTHCTLGIDQPSETESLAHTSLQLFWLVCSMFQCNTRACSPTRGRMYMDVGGDIVCRSLEIPVNGSTCLFFDILVSIDPSFSNATFTIKPKKFGFTGDVSTSP